MRFRYKGSVGIWLLFMGLVIALEACNPPLPPDPPVITLTLSSTSITAGESVTLTWNATNVGTFDGKAFCQLFEDPQGPIPPQEFSTACSGSASRQPATDTRYTFRALKTGRTPSTEEDFAITEATVLVAGAETPNSELDVTVNPNAISIAKGTSDSVTVTVSKTNFDAPVTLSLSGAPAGVTGSFSTNPVVRGELKTQQTSTLTLNVAANAAAGTSTLTITGSDTGLSDTATLTLDVQPSMITVTGKVIDVFGQPQTGLAVKIGTSTTNTDTNGNFTISNVTPPYDAIVIHTFSTAGYVFEGLIRNDPTLQLFAIPFTAEVSATIETGSLSGSAVGFPNPANHRAYVGFGSDEGFSNPSTFLPGEGPAFGPITVNWAGSPTTTGALHALQLEVDASSLPIDYTGYGMTPLSLSNGGTFNSPATDIALSNGVSDSNLTGTANLPTGYTMKLISLYADFGTNQSLPLLFDNLPNTTFTYTTPNLPSANITTVVQANDPSGLGFSGAFITGSAPNESAISLSIPQIPELILPVDNATDVDTTTPFSWQPFPNGIHVVAFGIGGGIGGTTYIVITAASETTIPDLSAEGLPLPVPMVAGVWNAVGIAPFSTVDEAAGPSGYAQDFYRGLGVFEVAPEDDGSFGFTNPRDFTTP